MKDISDKEISNILKELSDEKIFKKAVKDFFATHQAITGLNKMAFADRLKASWFLLWGKL
jgi:hypothetical protein